MWRVIIHCSEAGWQSSAQTFLAIANNHPGTPLSTKKMAGDDRRIMEYEFEDPGDAEDFVAECMTLDGFIARFEAA